MRVAGFDTCFNLFVRVLQLLTIEHELLGDLLVLLLGCVEPVLTFEDTRIGLLLLHKARIDLLG